jgi:hypothetical protein
MNHAVGFDNSQSFLFKRTPVCLRGKVWAVGHDVRSAWSRVTRMEGGLSNARSGNVDLVLAVSLDIYGGAGASGVLDPLGRSLLATGKQTR